MLLAAMVTKPGVDLTLSHGVLSQVSLSGRPTFNLVCNPTKLGVRYVVLSLSSLHFSGGAYDNQKYLESFSDLLWAPIKASPVTLRGRNAAVNC